MNKTGFRTTYYLGSQEIRKGQENLKTKQNYNLVSSPPSKIKTVDTSKKLLKNRN